MSIMGWHSSQSTSAPLPFHSHQYAMPSFSQPSPSPTIALAAGGTGGHLFPAEALARELIARGYRVVIHTEHRGAGYAHALAGLDHVVLPASHLEGGLVKKARAALTIACAVWQSRADLKRRKVALMVGFGGYPSFAPALAARSLGMPLLLHEQASRLSKANRQLLRWASALAVSFPEVEGAEGFDRARIHHTGNPVRQSILDARLPYPELSIDGPVRLLVIGGSQSAEVFGRVVPPALLALPGGMRRRLHVDLQHKEADPIAEHLRDGGISAEVRPFFEDIGARLAAAHLVITRAGASTAADLVTIGRPAIFVPLPRGGSRQEQARNAQTLAKTGVGWVIPEPELTPMALAARLSALLGAPEQLKSAAQAAAALATPAAAARLADLVERHLA